MIRQPLNQALHQRNLLGLGAIPAFEPAAHLPFQKSSRLAERHQPVLFDVHSMQLHQAVHKAPAHSRRIVWDGYQFRRNAIAHHDAMPPLHDEENGSDNRSVLAQMKNFGRGVKERMHSFEHHVFARHVVRLGRHRPQWTSPQHILACRRAQQICQIRMAARELFDSQTRAALNLVLEILGQRSPVQLFAGANGRCISAHASRFLGCSVVRFIGLHA